METGTLDDAITHLDDEVAEKDLSVLPTLVQRAIWKVRVKRYPFGYTGAEKEIAVERYCDTIFFAAIYHWVKQGADGKSSHSKNGVGRAYEKEDDIYFDIASIARII